MYHVPMKDCKIEIRVSAEEHQTIKDIAKRHGLTISAMVRKVLLALARR